MRDGGTANKLGYLPALDGLRCFAVLFVVVSHLGFRHGQGGWAGVDIFFAISGFLITTLLLQEKDTAGGVAYGRFYLRRIIRLTPALLVVVACSTALALATGTAEPGIVKSALAALLYLTPVTRKLVDADGLFDHTWSLGIEEYFYLAWPLLLVLFLTRLGARALLATLTLAGALLLYGVYAWSVAVDNETGLLRGAGIALGCAYALWVYGRPRSGRPAPWLWLGVVGILGAVVAGEVMALRGVAYPLAAVSTLCVIRAVLGGADRLAPVRFLSFAPIVFLGAVSYEIYLWHFPLLVLAPRIFDVPPSHLSWWVAPLSILVAIGTHLALRPLQRRWKRRALPASPVKPTLASEASTF